MISKNLEHYQKQRCPQDRVLLAHDPVTYAVLITILDIPCSHIYTNHESVVIAFSGAPFPVWVWVKDSEVDEDVDCVAECLRTAFPLEEGFDYNISYELLERLKGRDPYFAKIGTKMRLLSYQLNRLNPINEQQYTCKGYAALCEEKDLELLAKYWHDMSVEMEGFEHEEAYCREHVMTHIKENGLFAWHDENGVIVALTSRNNNGAHCKVGAVYTVPAHRRKGYAIKLVHHVTEMILADGLIPILYTNADYGASNDCYKKIGYEEVGSLCTACK